MAAQMKGKRIEVYNIFEFDALKVLLRPAMEEDLANYEGNESYDNQSSPVEEPRKGEYEVEKSAEVPIAPTHVYSINDSLLAEEAAAAEYEFVIRQLVRTQIVGVFEISDCPKFDLILLGMGSYGHVASLFPNHSVLNEKEEWVTFIIESVINSSTNVAVVVTGSSKAEVLHRAINNVEGPSLPAKMVQPTNGKLALFLDKLVASKLDGGAQFSE